MRKVWLNSPADYLVIEPDRSTDVSVDVNSGKVYRQKENRQETYRKINLEAAKEIATTATS